MGAQAALFVPRPEFDMVGRAADERLKGVGESRSWFINR
jgi:hypothetical protein